MNTVAPFPAIRPSDSRSRKRTVTNYQAQANVRQRLALTILLLVLVSAVTTYAGIQIGNDPIKIFSVACQGFATVVSLSAIIRYRQSVHWHRTFVILTIITFYPLVRIIWDVTQDFDFKTFTGIILSCSYYQLAIVGLGLGVLTQDGSGYKLLSKIAPYALVASVLLLPLILHITPAESIGWGRIVLDNLLIPVAILALIPSSKVSSTLGWVSTILILYLGSMIYSRSYVMVGCEIIALATFSLFAMKRKNLGVIIITFLIIFCAVMGGASVVSGPTALGGQGSITDKFQLDSLVESWNSAFATGDPMELFRWKGNSRAQIVTDAFSDFDLPDWVFGEGILAKYHTVFSNDNQIDRNTIEIGFAQELFRWGWPYILFTVYLMGCVARKYLTASVRESNPTLWILGGIVVVKALDSFVYGMPTFSVYNLLVFWGIMNLGLRKKRRVEPGSLVRTQAYST